MAQTSATLLWQNPTNDSSHMFKLLRQHLQAEDIVRFRAAVAYVSWGGLSLIAEALEDFLKQGKLLETIYGVENGVTTPDALLYSVYLQRRFANYQTAKSYRWNYVDSEFHAKYFEFEYPDRAVCIIGSGNLTGGGVACNHELATAIASPHQSTIRKRLDNWWRYYLKDGEAITPQAIRAIKTGGRLGSEQTRKSPTDELKVLGLKLPRAKKPLFQHILDDGRQPQARHDVLAEADALSEKPNRLYLQILENETGGGHQIQLPVATLGAFFGVGTGETKGVEFAFPQTGDSVEVQLTHFGNNTHRVRLRPLKQVPRPGVVVFRRTAEPDRYECRVVPASRYNQILRQMCSEQTRKDSRLWGFGD